MLPLQVRVDLGTMVMKEYPAVPKAPIRLFNIISRPLVRGVTPLQRSSRCILQPLPTGQSSDEGNKLVMLQSISDRHRTENTRVNLDLWPKEKKRKKNEAFSAMSKNESFYSKVNSPIGSGCRIHQLNLCRVVSHHRQESWIRHNIIWWYYLPTPPLGQDMTQGQFLIFSSFNGRPKLTYIPYFSFNGQSFAAC